MFTDVRLNAKGGTLELRTPDSRPVQDFRPLWKKFVRLCEEETAETSQTAETSL